MSLFKGLNTLIRWSGTVLQPFFLLAIRLLWGFGFFWAGFGKFENIDKVIEFFTSLNIPLPVFNAYLVATVETLGGLLLIFGLGARFIAVLLTIVMLTAFGTAHIDAVKGVFTSFRDNFGAFSTQAPIGFLLTALTVWCFGPGLFSLDAIFCKFFCRNSE